MNLALGVMNKQPKTRIVGIVLATAVFGAAIMGYFAIKNAPKEDVTQVSPTPSMDAPSEVATKSTAETQSTGDKKVDLKQALEVGADGLSKGVVVINTARGKMKYRFYSKDAPNTAARMADLVQSGFYNGLIFHRVVPGFVIQGGDPTGTGMGGSGTKLKAEFNSRKHVPGAVAMARSQSPDSADSQFYVTTGTHPHLDGQYTVFGQLIEGQDVAKQIQQGDRMTEVTIEMAE